MSKPLTLSLGIVGLTAIALAGFAGGRFFGARTHPPRIVHGITTTTPFVSSFAATGNEPNPRIPPDQIYEDVLDKVQQNFVDGVASTSRLSDAALARMLASLDDPHTCYLEPAYREARQDSLKGRYHGIGAALCVRQTQEGGVERRRLTVVDVMPNSPAEKAGIRSADVITHIDDRWIIAYGAPSSVPDSAETAASGDAGAPSEPRADGRVGLGYGLARAMALLCSGESKTLRLTIRRTGHRKALTVLVRTGLTEVQPVEFRLLAGRVGYLRVRQFNAHATHLFQNALDSAAALGPRLKGVIIDLRSNPGGVRAETAPDLDGFASARKLLARLTRGGNVAVLERRKGVREPLAIVGAKSALLQPKVVLVDCGTANLAELTAAALHDGGAKLLGTHTFGDNVLELFAPFKSGGGVQMAAAHLFSSSGADISRGIEPNVVTSSETAASDELVRLALRKLGV